MRRLILLIFICFSLVSLSLEIEKVTEVNVGTVIEKNRVDISNASEIWVLGEPGRRVKLEIPREVKEGNRNVKINIDKIYLRKDIVTLDKRGKGKFDMGIRINTKGSGKFQGEIPVAIKYIN